MKLLLSKNQVQIEKIASMRYTLMILLAILNTFNVLAQGKQNPNENLKVLWSEEKANEWYTEQPWPCGFNYIPANAISYTEMWMPYCFNPTFIDKELSVAEDIGFNCLRVVLPFVV